MDKPNLRSQANRQVGSHIRLTPAEQKTLPLIGQGLSPKEIAAILGITAGTAAIRVSKIKEKLRS